MIPKKNEAKLGKKKPSGNLGVSIPEGFVIKCTSCKKIVFKEELEENLGVCPKCGYHSRLSAPERVRQIADPETFVEMYDYLEMVDPIGFPGYRQKVEGITNKTGLRDSVVAGYCCIQGTPCLLGVMDTRFMMASMGSVAGEKITRLFEDGAREHLPVVIFTASGGARMQEGILSLMQMAKTAAAVAKHSEEGGLYITVLTDPTLGGVTASFANLGDLILAEPGAVIGFAGRRLIEDTMRQKLPEDFQTTEFLKEHGFVDHIVSRRELRPMLGFLLHVHDPAVRKATRKGNVTDYE